MQDNTKKTSPPPQKKKPVNRKGIDSNLRQPPKNKMSAKKKCFAINFMHLLHKECQILSLYQSVC